MNLQRPSIPRWMAVVLVASFAGIAASAARGQNSTDEGCPFDPRVLDLLRLDRRESAFQELFARKRYRGEGTYVEKNAGTVRHVVVCPQPKAPPILAVFARPTWEGDPIYGPPGTPPPPDAQPRADEKLHRPLGHLILFDHAGVIVRFPSGANLIDGAFFDVNGDGIVEAVQSWTVGVGENRSVEQIVVVPIVEPLRPALRVAYHRRGPGLDESERWSWSLESGGEDAIHDLVLGPVGENGTVISRVRYEWSAEDARWVGPDGGADQPYQRVLVRGHEPLVEYANGGLR